MGRSIHMHLRAVTARTLSVRGARARRARSPKCISSSSDAVSSSPSSPSPSLSDGAPAEDARLDMSALPWTMTYSVSPSAPCR